MAFSGGSLTPEQNESSWPCMLGILDKEREPGDLTHPSGELFKCSFPVHVHHTSRPQCTRGAQRTTGGRAVLSAPCEFRDCNSGW